MNMYCPTCGKPKLEPGVPVNIYAPTGEWPYCTCLPLSVTQPITTTTYTMTTMPPALVSPLSPEQDAEVRRIISEEIDKRLEQIMIKGKPDDAAKS